MLQKHRRITAERCDKFISREFFNDVNLISQLFDPKFKLTPKATTTTTAQPQSDEGFLSIKVFSPEFPDQNAKPGQAIPIDRNDAIYHNASFEEMKKMEGEASKNGKGFRPCKVGDSFGKSWSTHWFRIEGKIPRAMRERVSSGTEDRIVLRWLTGAEGFLYSSDGKAIQGIVDRREHLDIADLVLSSSGDEFLGYIEMACNGMFGNGQDGLINAPNEEKSFTLSTCELVVYQGLPHRLFYHFQIINDLSKCLPEDSTRGVDALYTANEICNVWQPLEKSSWTKCIEIAESFLFSGESSSKKHEIHAVGHCHIDTAWLWPYRETRRKCGRSWSTQLALMEKFPESLIFVCSQAQQYEWVKEDYPELFERIRSKVQESSSSSNFFPIGSTWVEMDCNIPSGESLVRQFFYGQRFYEEEFGRICRVFWLPDTFGYSSQLPQIMKKSEAEYFFTQKLSWNNINVFPHSTFFWRGLDGTQVLTHFSPANTYCSQATVKEVLFCESNNKDKDRANASLLVFGDGDGGGGPTTQMLENLTRMQRGIEGLPKIITTKSNPEAFYDTLAHMQADRPLPVWNGELYFELHRGTYTSQAANKRLNRQCEFLLLQVEALSALVPEKNVERVKELLKEIDDCWKIVLLNQFHDVLPGSSIQPVYRDSVQMYERVVKKLGERRTELLGRVKRAESASISFWNSLPFERFGDKYTLVEVKGTYPDLTQYAHQRKADDEGVLVLLNNEKVKGFGIYQSPVKKVEERIQIQEDGSNIVLENSLVKVVVSKQSGQVTSYWDKEVSFELVQKNSSFGAFNLYEDVPLFWDAWDIEIYHLEKKRPVQAPVSVEINDKGPLLVSVKVKYSALTGDSSKTSSLEVGISLAVNSRLLAFDVVADWREKHQLLKGEFSTSIWTDFMTCDTQFGTLKRPTTRNNSWEMAKFEVCAHRFVHLSEFGYGVALLSDSKYGFGALQEEQGTSLSLSLLRGPTAPDPTCDEGIHHFRFGIYGHPGASWQDAGVYQMAYQFNVPPVELPLKNKEIDDGLVVVPFDLKANSLFIEVIKRGHENSASSLIVRCFEAFGGRGQATILSDSTTPGQIKSIKIVNLLERGQFDEAHGLKASSSNGTSSSSWTFSYNPYEIITLLIEFN